MRVVGCVANAAPMVMVLGGKVHTYSVCAGGDSPLVLHNPCSGEKHPNEHDYNP